MKRNPQVIAFMTPFPYSIDVEAPLEEAHRLMRAHDFRHVPVTSQGELIGVLTDRDIRLMVVPDAAPPQAHALRVRDGHIEPPCVIAASTPIAKVARLMAERHISSAIVTKHEKLVGIFTVTDACRALAEVIEGHGDESDSAA